MGPFFLFCCHKFCLDTLARRTPVVSWKTARWGVVQLVGHLTVNEDGEGSNPSAPAKNDGIGDVGFFCTDCRTFTYLRANFAVPTQNKLSIRRSRS